LVFYLFAIAQGTQFTQNYEFFIKIESNLTIIKIVHLIMNNQRLVAEQERRFRRACEQIAQLDYKLHYTQKKYNKAKKDRRLTLRYSYLLQIVAMIFWFHSDFCGNYRKNSRCLLYLSCLIQIILQL
jgi:hypothetical protein